MAVIDSDTDPRRADRAGRPRSAAPAFRVAHPRPQAGWWKPRLPVAGVWNGLDLLVPYGLLAGGGGLLVDLGLLVEAVGAG
jgi:hypothetical protein